MKRTTKSLCLSSPVVKCVRDKFEADDYNEACHIKKRLIESNKYYSVGTLYFIDGKYIIYAVRKNNWEKTE